MLCSQGYLKKLASVARTSTDTWPLLLPPLVPSFSIRCMSLPHPYNHTIDSQNKPAKQPTESDPLLRSPTRFGTTFRSRKSSKSSPVSSAATTMETPPNHDETVEPENDEYDSLDYEEMGSRQPSLEQHQQALDQEESEPAYRFAPDSNDTAPISEGPLEQVDNEEMSPNDPMDAGGDSGSQLPLLEIPEEIYAVRKAALKVLKPLTKTWVSSTFLLCFHVICP